MLLIRIYKAIVKIREGIREHSLEQLYAFVHASIQNLAHHILKMKICKDDPNTSESQNRSRAIFALNYLFRHKTFNATHNRFKLTWRSKKRYDLSATIFTSSQFSNQSFCFKNHRPKILSQNKLESYSRSLQLYSSHPGSIED